MNESTLKVVKAQGKTFLGQQSKNPNVLLNVVELVTTFGMSTEGVKKQVVMMGIDYCKRPIKSMRFPPGVMTYLMKDLPRDAHDAMKEDYDRILCQDNLVTVPSQGILFPE